MIATLPTQPLFMGTKTITLLACMCAIASNFSMMKHPRPEGTTRPRRVAFEDFAHLATGAATSKVPDPEPKIIYARSEPVMDGVSSYKALVAECMLYFKQPLLHRRGIDLDDRIIYYKPNGKRAVYCKCTGCGTYMIKGTCGYVPTFAPKKE